jgi:TPR repeat protein
VVAAGAPSSGRDAAEADVPDAFGVLAYAYDLGLGTSADQRLAARWYRRAYRSGDNLGAMNLATIYRDAGNLVGAFRWWQRAADLDDGDSLGDVGYCYQYGIGVWRDVRQARIAFRRAIRANSTTEYGREEAMYHLAVSYLDQGQRQMAIPLLKRAAGDGDYPEAMAALDQIREGKKIDPCRCRRHIRKELAGHAKCMIHPRNRRKRRAL